MTAEPICETTFVQTLLDIAKFPERHRAVANTWADHFGVPSERRDEFILHYLTHTSSTRCWCVTLNKDDSVARPTVARFGRQLQYFDGQLISAVRFDEKRKVPVHAPTTGRALKLAHQLIAQGSTDALLTSFCKHARDLARDESELSIKPLVKYNLGVLSSEGKNKRFYAPRNRFYITCIGATLKKFCQSLDQELLHAVRSVQCPSAKLYNWLAQGDRKRRLQALKAQPVLVPVLVLGDGMPWPMETEQRVAVKCPWGSLQEFCYSWEGDYTMDVPEFLGRAVDAGLPLNDVFAWLLSAPKSAIRYLGQLRVYDTGSALTRLNAEGLDSGWNALIAGARLGNRRPRSKAEWRSFYSIHSSIPWQVLISLRDMNNFLKGCPTDWADTAWPGITAKLVDLRELFNNLDRVGSSQTMGTQKRLHDFIGLMTYRQLSNFVDAFHHALTHIRVNLERELPLEPSDSLTRWPGLLQDDGPIKFDGTGLEIVELRCPHDLDLEHRAMGHCIDTYDYRAYSGDCRLLSIRSDDCPVASIEITLRPSPNERKTGELTLKHLHLAQVRGLVNQPPAPDSGAMKAVEWFMAAAWGARIAVNLEWPNMATKMDRYADKASIYNIRFGEEVIGWAEHYMDRGL
ncbi:PcfJ domain-containing protein [Pseudomonas syringae]|uniref:PcfJ domain-containing protein n=1 Tax=Pseudomonas syringae TaxID=317 RepID=UPI000409957E|nr:PcfJ domain-containing protein [Pseudomonas syringae]